MPNEEWVLVESERDLRAGIWVKIARCRVCGRTEKAFIVREKVAPGYSTGRDGHLRPDPASKMFLCIGLCMLPLDIASRTNGMCTLLATIKDRRLYRLVLRDDATNSESRELERTEL